MSVLRLLAFFAFCVLGRAENTPATPSAIDPPVAALSADAQMTSDVMEGKVSVAAAIARLRELSAVTGESAHGRTTLFIAACLRASPTEIPELAPVLAKFPQGSDDIEQCFSAYTSAALQHEVEKLKRNPRKLKLAETAEPVPDFLSTSPAEFRKAWKAWRSAVAPCFPLKKAAEKAAEEQKVEEPGTLESTLRKMLSPPAADLWKELFLYVPRDNFSLHFHGDRYQLRNRAMALSLLRDGRIEDAIAMACSHIGAGMDDGWQGTKPYAATLIEFLTAVGLDWEPIFFGASLKKDEHDPLEDTIISTQGLAYCASWNALGALGSTRGVDLGLALIREKNLGGSDAMQFLVSAAGPQRGGEREVDPDPTILRRTKILPAKLRSRVIAAFSRLLENDESLDVLAGILSEVPEWLTGDLKKPLGKLVKHSNHRIASSALKLLVDAGLANPKTKISPAAKSVRVRLLLDGRPLTHGKVSIFTGEQYKSGFETDSDGRLIVSLEEVTEPGNLEQISIDIDPTVDENDGDPAGPAIGPKADPKVWRGPCVTYEVKVKSGQEREVEMNVETGELEVGLEGADGVPNDTEIKVSLAQGGDMGGLYGEMEAVGKPGDSVSFQRLQLGKYNVKVEGKGLLKIAPVEVHVVKAGSLKLVKLLPGRDVTGILRALDGKKKALFEETWMFSEATRDGVKFDMHNYLGEGTLNGIPFGKYRFRIASMSEFIDAAKANGQANVEIPAAQRFAELEINFELNAASPPVVDLGVIKLKPEAREK